MTTTAVQTIKTALDEAEPNLLADALRKVKLGTVLTVLVEDSGVINPESATVTLAKPALFVQSARVTVSATDVNNVGSYMVTDDDAAAVAVTPSASARLGIATLSADGLMLTFPTAVGRCITQYIPRPDADLTDAFANA